MLECYKVKKNWSFSQQVLSEVVVIDHMKLATE